jgi:hypothetical protein
METTMTTAKSLVTVTVDNVFRSFPIDEERYELLDMVGLVVETIFNDKPLRFDRIDDERTKLFLEGVHENFALGATSLLRKLNGLESPDEIPAIVIDRANRTAASMNTYDAEYDSDSTPRENVDTWVWCLWANLYEALKNEHLDPTERAEEVRRDKNLRIFFELGRRFANS